jgi:hypothetical protein
MTADEVAAICADAYSADRYRSWRGVASALLQQGLTPLQTEAVMRSKWTRWAADAHSARYGQVPTKAIVAFVKKQTPGEIEALTIETFGKAA